MQLQEDVLDLRKAALDAWVSAQLNARVMGEPASSDASFRRYFRYQLADKSYVAMDAPPDKESCEPFVRIARQLGKAGIAVPHIHAENLAQGFLLLNDMGTQTWLHRITAHNADAWFAAAIQTLIAIQQVPPTGLPAYDRALIERELALFPDWYLARERQLALPDSLQADWQQLCQLLVDNMLAQPQVFVHRDFMPRNLMVSDPNPGVIDFQDAVVGPIAYDPVCLFRDAFLSWPESRTSDWLAQYHRQALLAGLPLPADVAQFKRWADLTGVQRHLKVIGIFARIFHRDGKPHYLKDVPRFFDYLRTQANQYDELQSLQRILQWLDAA